MLRFVSTSDLSDSYRAFKIFDRNVDIKMQTYKDKATAIRKVEKGLKTRSLIAKELGIPLNTLSTYFKNKENILSKSAAPSKKDRKSLGIWKILKSMNAFTSVLNRYAIKNSI